MTGLPTLLFAQDCGLKPGSREMAHSVKCLLCKHEDPSSIPEPVQNQTITKAMQPTFAVPTLEKKKWWIPGTPYSADF